MRRNPTITKVELSVARSSCCQVAVDFHLANDSKWPEHSVSTIFGFGTLDTTAFPPSWPACLAYTLITMLILLKRNRNILIIKELGIEGARSATSGLPLLSSSTYIINLQHLSAFAEHISTIIIQWMQKSSYKRTKMHRRHISEKYVHRKSVDLR